MCPRIARRSHTRGPRSHHRTSRTHRSNIQLLSWGAARLWMFAWRPLCSSSPRRCSAGCLWSKNVPTVERKSKIFDCKVVSPVKCSGRLMGGHTLRSRDPAICSRHRSMPQWTTNDSNSPSNTGGNIRFELPSSAEEQE